MLDHGAYLVPTLVAPLGVIRGGRGGRRRSRGGGDQGARGDRGTPRLVPAAVEAGVKVAMGTDDAG